MTDFQAKQIRELRLRGAGYKSIASAVGLSRDTVRNYCKSHGLDGYASALVLNVKEQMESGTACLSSLPPEGSGSSAPINAGGNGGQPIRKPLSGRKALIMKPPVFTVERHSARMEIRTAGTALMNVM